MSLRKIYQEHHNVVLENNVEVHHIVPRHEGGSDEMSNLVAITKEEHAKTHLERYHKYGNFRDLCAYHMIGYNFTEAHRISSSIGGKIGGKRVRDSSIGIFRSDTDRTIWASMGGKVGGKSQAKNGSKWHLYKLDSEAHRVKSSLGGKTSGVFQNKDFQSEMGKRGGKNNKGYVWLNDGIKSFKYTAKQQQESDLDMYLNNNPHIKRGRIISCLKK